jgi:hypothetical protein
MFWVIVFGVIALGGLAMVICFGVSLWRKSQSLLDEVGVLLARADELAGLLDQIEVSVDPAAPARFHHLSDEHEADIEATEIGLSRR